jgi:hypothetical protein
MLYDNFNINRVNAFCALLYIVRYLIVFMDFVDESCNMTENLVR